MTDAKAFADHLLKYLEEHGRLDLLPEIAELLGAEAARREEISVISAAPLDEAERTNLERTLTEKWGQRPLSFVVDPVIVSGLLIRFRHTVIDLTGRSSLTDLAAHLS